MPNPALAGSAEGGPPALGAVDRWVSSRRRVLAQTLGREETTPTVGCFTDCLWWGFLETVGTLR